MPKRSETLISFVIPCYKSEDCVVNVLEEIKTVMAAMPACSFEVVAVNDNSPDNVFQVLENYGKRNQFLRIVDLAFNCGKHAAVMAGYSIVKGDIIVNLDDDGQCPLDSLNLLLEPLKGNFDIAIAQYGVKKQSLFKNFGSFVNSCMVSYLLSKPKTLELSNFSALKRFIVREITKYKNPYPYLDGLFLRSTSKIVNVPMTQRKRINGKGNYSFRKSVSLFLNGFTAFSVKPLRVASFLGIVISLIGFISGTLVVVRKLINADIAIGYSSIMSVLLFLNGVVMLMLGMLGEYIGRMYISMNNLPQYVISRIIQSGRSLKL